MKDLIKKTPEFKALRAEAREAIAAYADGADFLFTISRLAAIGERMNAVVERTRFQGRRQPTSARGRPRIFPSVTIPFGARFFCGSGRPLFCLSHIRFCHQLKDRHSATYRARGGLSLPGRPTTPPGR